MKTNFFMSLLLLLFFGCTKQESAQMTPQEQDNAKKEIRAIANQILHGAENMDVEAVSQPYLNSPDFIQINTDGSMVDFQGRKNGTTEFLKSLVSLKFTTIKDEFRFLPDNIVLYAWLGKCEMTLKTGEHLNIDSYAATDVFTKMINQWKIIYSHESASPAVQEKPKK